MMPSLTALLRPLAAVVLVAGPLLAAEPTPSRVSPVFQYMYSGTCTAWSDGSKTTHTTYLWIPEQCRKLRGLIIIAPNVPEHGIVGHPAIRAACAANDLGIAWGGLLNFSKKPPENKEMIREWGTTAVALQGQLDGLATVSGYEEVATVPWLPMGESTNLLLVDALMEAKPDHCLAGVFIKNSHLPPKNRTTPALVTYGTAQEWGQDTVDIRTRWNNVGKTYDGILAERKKNPDWALSYVIDGHSGHFDCSDRMTRYIATYVDAVAKARLTDDGSPVLRPVTLAKGFVADLSVPGHEGQPVKPAEPNEALPWFFDRATASEAQAFAAINWKAECQLPAFCDGDGQVHPFNFRGITDVKSLTMEADGITFTVRGTMLDRLPANFVGAGEKLAKAPGDPVVEWLCGSAEPVGEGRFRVALNRMRGPVYLAARHPGNDSICGAVQPARIELLSMRNTEGLTQKITFPAISDVPAGTASVPLAATSDASLPVSYYVEAGPAVVQGDRLVFTAIPPRSRLPLEVTVVAWQWGRAGDPKVKTADAVKRTFRITAP